MKNFIYLFAVCLMLSCFLQPKISLADGFTVNLNYNQTTGNLSLGTGGVIYDKNLNVPLPQTDNPEGNGSYEIILFADKGIQIFTKKFDPQTKPLSINLPYFSIAKNLEIVDSVTNKIILQSDISALSTCNNNGICEFDKGENIYTCIPDCASSNIKYDQQTLDLLQKNDGVLKDVTTGKTLLSLPASQTTTSTAKNNYFTEIIIMVATAIILGALIFILVKRRR